MQQQHNFTKVIKDTSTIHQEEIYPYISDLQKSKHCGLKIDQH